MSCSNTISKIKELLDIDNDGFDPELIVTAEKRLGILLPKSLMDYYQIIGKHEAINYHNYLIEPQNLEFYNDYLFFYNENQGVFSWGLKREELLNGACKVYRTEDLKQWVVADNEIDDFLFKMAIIHAFLIFPYRYRKWNLSNEEKQIIRHEWQESKLKIDFFSRSEYFFKSTNEILEIAKNRDGTIYLTICSKKFETVHEIKSIIGGDDWQII